MQNQTKVTGLVISYFGNSVAVEAEDGQVFQCYLRRNQALPVVGDQVEWQFEQGEQGTILQILPRHSLLMRGDGHGKMKALAANLDLIMIVMAPPPIFSEYLVDRYLAAAELLHIPSLLVLNKIDLLQDLNLIQERLQIYQNIPYPIVLSSIFQDDTIHHLAAYLQQKTAVLVGPSGVGKSSLINALASNKAIRVGDVSPKGAGKHTTTATRLYHLPDGGRLIDSPGVREFNLWTVNKQDMPQCFKEFAPFLQQCQFKDCKHLTEPSCAVQAALANGKISRERYASYQTLMKQARDESAFDPSSKKNKHKQSRHKYEK